MPARCTILFTTETRRHGGASGLPCQLSILCLDLSSQALMLARRGSPGAPPCLRESCLDAEIRLGRSVVEDFAAELFDLPAFAGPEEILRGARAVDPAVVVVLLVQREHGVAADDGAEAGDVPDAVAFDQVKLVDRVELVEFQRREPR